MKKYVLPFVLFICLFYNNILEAQELRGTWIARNSLSTKETLANAIDSLASNNFNTIYINVWSRGYPLWQSQVFKNHTGISIDPAYAGRDILAETIAEAHKHGLFVEAWFEYGFVGGWTGNQPSGKKGPIFDSHPNWIAKKKDGTEIDGSNFYWMIHTHNDVQRFLIDLSMELVRNYDIDGIELDRIRYSSLEYGYDLYTDSLYRFEHNNTPPPENIADAAWIKWRADKLNDFMSGIYDSIKTENPHINVSNAPSLYSSSSYTAYYSFCQDWAAWINNNIIDNIQVQSYVSSSSSFGAILDYIKTLVQDYQKVYPAFAISPNGNTIPGSELINYINITRQKGFKGNSIWFYTDLISYFPLFKQTVYAEKVYPPHSPFNWRTNYSIARINDTSAVKRIGIWNTSTIPAGLSGNSLVNTGSASASLEYTFDVPENGNYELYVFNVVAPNRNDSAKYYVRDSLGVEYIFYVDQTNNPKRRFVKLGDFKLSKGKRTPLLLTNENLKPGRSLSGDAAMIILNRRLTPDSPTSVNESLNELKKKEDFKLEAYPNPFNSSVKVSFNVFDPNEISIKLYNLLGQELYSYNENVSVAGNKTLNMNFSNFTTGVYFLELRQNRNREIIKLSYVK